MADMGVLKMSADLVRLQGCIAAQANALDGSSDNAMVHLCLLGGSKKSM